MAIPERPIGQPAEWKNEIEASAASGIERVKLRWLAERRMVRVQYGTSIGLPTPHLMYDMRSVHAWQAEDAENRLWRPT